MKNTAIAALLAGSALLSVTFGAAAAGSETPRVDQRQANQQQRIEQGVDSGQLTKRETRHLERQQARVATAEAQAKADGTVTHAERRHLTRMQNHDSRAIARQKHDAQTQSGVKSN